MKNNKSHPELQNAKEDNVVSILQDIKNQYPDLENVVLADKSGSAVNESGQKLSASDREYFLKAKKSDSIVISDIITSQVTGNKVIVFVKPMVSSSGEFSDAFMLSVNADEIINAVNEIKIRDTGYGYLLNKGTEVILTHPDTNNVGKKFSDVNTDSTAFS